MANGFGKYQYSTGSMYEGEWVNNEQNGKGKEIDNKGIIYEGDFVNS